METIDTSWDVDKYKTSYEMEHEWALKKKFMLAHKDKFTEDRVVSLAALFCNINFLGCKYSEPVMEMIDDLSKGIAEKNQKWESQSFVSASAAVEKKFKDNNRDVKPPTTAKDQINFVQGSNLGNGEEPGPKNEVWVRGQKRSSDGWDEGSQPYKRSRRGEPNVKKHLSIERKRIQDEIRRVVESGPFGKVVVFHSATFKDENPISVIQRTASAAHMVINFDYDTQNNQVECKLSLDGMFLASGEGKNQKAAKETACRVALDRLKETSFTIMVKASFVSSDSVDRSLNPDKEKEASSNVDTPIAESNIGNKMMKLMGWTGGGLGKNEQGIEEPIKPYDCNVRRSGLGIANFSDFRRKILRIIEDFAYRESNNEDLVFSPEFSKEERKVIHELVSKYNLKSRSFGKEEERRQLVVFKKIRPLEIVEDLIACGGETGKYVLTYPLSMNSDCPMEQ